jgi:glycosyltransferase involved in cell wall biosynthesis
MKVLHITTNDFLGAGLCVLRIHQALLSQGIESKVLVANKQSQVPLVFEMEPNVLPIITKPKNKFLRKVYTLLRMFGLFKNRAEKEESLMKDVHWNTLVTWFSPITEYDLLQSDLVKEADILHLHWVAGFVDYESFFRRINKPIIWTLHDQNIALGGFHYMRDKLNNYECCSKIEDRYVKLKQDAISCVKDLHIVALSNMMEEFIQKQAFLAKRPIHRIYNCVNCDIYKPISKNLSRSVLGIPDDVIVLAFCACRLYDERKGLKDLILALESIGNKKVAVLCIGGGNLPVETSVTIYQTGELNNDQLMAFVYSAADYFALPSYQEVFAQTPLEAMACGLPVVAYPCSGTSDLINDSNGIICQDFTIDSLKNGLMELMAHKYNPNVIRNYILENYTPEHIAQDYINLYNSLL